MSGINGIMNIASGALMAQQEAITVTGNNIANVNTPGYSRQRVNMTTNPPVTFHAGQMGTGVRTAGVQRVYDRFLGDQINDENQALGQWEAQKNILENVELVFEESSGFGLNQSMSEFWGAWQDLSNNPLGYTERVMLLSKSDNLASAFSQLRGDLVAIQNDADNRIQGGVEEVNRIADQIADLNMKITSVEVTGQNANDYRDQRDLLLKELSSLTDITVQDSGGSFKVLMGGAQTLIDNADTFALSAVAGASGLHAIQIDTGGGSVDVTGSIAGGKLKGWLDARDTAVPDYIDRLDSLATGIMDQINAIHSTGFGLDNTTGADFFAGTSAGDMQVNPTLAASPDSIGAAQAADAAGDNRNAIAIAALQQSLSMSGGGATFDDYYGSLVGAIGSAVQKADSNHEHQSAMMDHLENYRESVSGVSLDEEMVNLIQFQHAYDAAAKLITTVDEMLSTVINMVR